MKDKDKKKTKFRKIKFGSRKFLRSSGLGAMSYSFENYELDDWGSGPDMYFSISNGVNQEVTLFEFKDIKKVSLMLNAFITKVEAVK